MFEQDHGCLGVVTLKVQDISHIRTAPTVDGLIRVTDDADVAMSCGKQLRDRVLCSVRVLIFVHEDVLKFLLVLFADLRVV